MIRKLFPHPLLSALLVLIWLFLVGSVTLGNLLMAVFLAILVPIFTAPYWPNRPKLHNPLMIAEYIIVVLWDIVVANFVVAAIILFKRNKDMRPAWICVPLELTSPEAITVLAGTITMTPGTVTSMISADARSLLVHCLHTDDPDAIRDQIKSRYERRLLETFS